MFDNPDFYPTPEPVIKQMLAPFLGKEHQEERNNGYGKYTETVYRNVDLGKFTVLEPSAGKGDILDYALEALKKRSSRHETSVSESARRRFYAIEQDPELVATLQGKNYRVIGTDFLEYTGDRQFDLIIANPPFSSGAAHVLRMWDVIAPGGHVVSLVNSETLLNAYSEERELLAKIIEDHGSVEHLGQAFTNAERKTDVNVSIIRLLKPEDREDRFAFNFGERSKGPDITEEKLHDGVARKDIVSNMMVRFEKVREAFIQYQRAQKQLEFYGADINSLLDHSPDILKLANSAIETGGSARERYNLFADDVQQQLWRVVMGKLNIENLLTHKIRSDFEKYSKQNGYMDFTKENVASLIEMLHENRGNILEQAIVAVFDIFTSYYSENRLHVEGWKTNSKWKVNRKLILPRWVRYADWSTQADLKKYGSEFRVNYHCSSEYGDIDKALCYITGQKYDRIWGIEQTLNNKFRALGKVYSGEKFDDRCESEFFHMRFFKKGTLHLEFKDEHLWEEFNLRATAGKLWLPEPEMKAYQARTHSPFEAAPVPTPALEAFAVAAQTVAKQLLLAAPVTANEVGQLILF